MQRINDGPLSHALYHWPFPFEIVRSLVYNSISNQATKISISLQTSYCVSVVDNGCGFPVQFKLGEPDPLKKPHGYGQTLKMVSLLGELGIYSKGKRYFGPHTLATRDTRVVVDKLYSKVPARRRFIDFTIEDRKIKGLLSKLSIRFHGVTFTYRFASKSEIIWDRFGSSLQRFKYEFGMDRMYNSRDFKWISTDESFSISGFSSATPEGCPERKLVFVNQYLYEDKDFESILQKMLSISGKKVDFYLDIQVPETFLDYGYRSSSIPFQVILGLFQRNLKYVSNAVESVPGLLGHIAEGGRVQKRTKVMESKVVSRNKDRKPVNLMIWSNPLFKTINCIPFRAHNSEPMKVSKRQISAFKIIGQFDKRFIIARCLGEGFDFIAALDQHASHERIRLERFISKYLDSELKYALCMTLLGLKTFNEEHKKRFIQDGFVIEQKHGMTQLTITRDLIVIPDDAQIKELLLNLETYYNQSNSHSAISAPILEYIKQRACKGAIKFGQKLTFGECLEIVEELQLCNDPFSCAHGRPSLVPLAQI